MEKQAFLTKFRILSDYEYEYLFSNRNKTWVREHSNPRKLKSVTNKKIGYLNYQVIKRVIRDLLILMDKNKDSPKLFSDFVKILVAETFNYTLLAENMESHLKKEVEVKNILQDIKTPELLAPHYKPEYPAALFEMIQKDESFINSKNRRKRHLKFIFNYIKNIGRYGLDNRIIPWAKSYPREYSSFIKQLKSRRILSDKYLTKYGVIFIRFYMAKYPDIEAPKYWALSINHKTKRFKKTKTIAV